ncbi:helix-turn-helix domain-containing protein [Rummeliibacillus suwonensis]|uniref:helix-turn-helix domain-containing protein n=1 Tax=Rummeliibacillus suwonensis TaxID=1306154 RepID=UPI0011B4C7EF|nr:helix-turn-helix transcriptional regulator [Rummeliibacillus suwonensis]
MPRNLQADYYIHIKLGDILKSMDIEQKEIAERIGTTPRNISEMVNNKTRNIPSEALAMIAKELKITDLNELLEIRHR